MLYSAPGNIVDWMYTRQKIKYSYAVHLRDTGTVCFFYILMTRTFYLFYLVIILVRVYVAREMDSANWGRDD